MLITGCALTVPQKDVSDDDGLPVGTGDVGLKEGAVVPFAGGVLVISSGEVGSTDGPVEFPEGLTEAEELYGLLSMTFPVTRTTESFWKLASAPAFTIAAI